MQVVVFERAVHAMKRELRRSLRGGVEREDASMRRVRLVERREAVVRELAAAASLGTSKLKGEKQGA